MKSIYEQLFENENLKKLFDHLPDDRKFQIQEGMKHFINDLENKILNPLKKDIENMPK